MLAYNLIRKVICDAALNAHAHTVPGTIYGAWHSCPIFGAWHLCYLALLLEPLLGRRGSFLVQCLVYPS